MAISGISNTEFLRPRNLARKARQFVLDCCGGSEKTFTIKNQKAIDSFNWIGEKISSPENRLILGVTALMSQPFIDARNKTLDDDIKEVVIARTIAKILVGTTTGVIIRKGSIKAIDYMTTPTEKITPEMKYKKLRQFLMPAAKKIKPENLTQYKNTMGTLLALGIMVFTNFLIDAPLTQLFTVLFVKMKNGGKDAKTK